MGVSLDRIYADTILWKLMESIARCTVKLWFYGLPKGEPIEFMRM